MNTYCDKQYHFINHFLEKKGRNGSLFLTMQYTYEKVNCDLSHNSDFFTSYKSDFILHNYEI